MICPKCKNTGRTIVIRGNYSKKGNLYRRRRECVSCGHRFTTRETIAHYINTKELLVD